MARIFFVGLASLATARAEAAPALHAAAAGAFDLEVAGLLEGVPAGESRWVRWADLRALPSREITVEGEFVPGPQRVTVVFLDDLLKNLPVKAEADTVLADCTDGYASIYTREYIAHWKPFVVLEINGAGPEAWPPAGLTFNPGPYVISVSDVIAPGVAAMLDVSHKRPWGVSRLRVVREADALKPFGEGEWAGLSASGLRGRELWVNSCFSCHKGPGEELGGTKGGRPFAVIRAYAQFNPGYLKTYVRTPTELNPSAKMAAHPHYTDEQLGELIDFIVGRKP
ncbi:MAG: cytochrome c [Burkholderiales bacterium]|nr:cytochrome c [Opitutaceae bacterium]